MGYPNMINGSESEVFNQYANERTPVGAKMQLADGRRFRFAEAGGTALVVGSLNQSELIHATDWLTEVIDTLSAGVTTLTGVGESGVEPGLNKLVNGYIYTDNAVTLPMMRIQSNTGDETTFTVELYNEIPTDIASGNTVSYFKNPWRDIIIKPASAATAIYAGVAKTAIAADAFGWVQTHGPASVLYDATTTAIAAVNDPVVADIFVAGAVSGAGVGLVEAARILGFSLGPIEGDGEQTAVFLRIE